MTQIPRATPFRAPASDNAGAKLPDSSRPEAGVQGSWKLGVPGVRVEDGAQAGELTLGRSAVEAACPGVGRGDVAKAVQTLVGACVPYLLQ